MGRAPSWAALTCVLHLGRAVAQTRHNQRKVFIVRMAEKTATTRFGGGRRWRKREDTEVNGRDRGGRWGRRPSWVARGEKQRRKVRRRQQRRMTTVQAMVRKGRSGGDEPMEKAGRRRHTRWRVRMELGQRQKRKKREEKLRDKGRSCFLGMMEKKERKGEEEGEDDGGNKEDGHGNREMGREENSDAEAGRRRQRGEEEREERESKGGGSRWSRHGRDDERRRRRGRRHGGGSRRGEGKETGVANESKRKRDKAEQHWVCLDWGEWRGGEWEILYAPLRLLYAPPSF